MRSIRRCLVRLAPLVAGAAGLVIAVAIMGASAARAQAGADTIYTVTTFDVAPSAIAQTIALLKQYRDAALLPESFDGEWMLGVDVDQDEGADGKKNLTGEV